MSSAIKLSGRQGGIEINLQPQVSFGKIVCATEKKLNELKRFLENSDIQITFSGRRLTAGQRAVLEHRIIKSVGQSAKITFTPLAEKDTSLYKGVVRSGTVLKSRGDLVVVGDVNPGAYLYAAGNIVVMGSLRGVACAGLEGGEDAYVAANDMRPSQIRIGGVIARSQGEVKCARGFSEIANIKDGRIIISRLKN